MLICVIFFIPHINYISSVCLLSMIISKSIYAAANGISSFFYGYCSIVCMPHLLYPSSVDGHLGCFHVLTIVKNAAVNIGVQCVFGLQFPLDICPGMWLVDHDSSIFSFFRNPHTVSSVELVFQLISKKSVWEKPDYIKWVRFILSFF